MITKDLIEQSVDRIATKRAFGEALVELGNTDASIVVLDGDLMESTTTALFAEAYPQRFFQMHIAEQNMVGVAVGLSRMGFKPVVSTFAAFLTRAHDQLRMAPLSGVSLYINGAYGGVSIGRDGPSQMGLEDIAMMRALYGSTVLYPSDAVSCRALSTLMFLQQGIVYLRTTREPTAVIYAETESFVVGGSKVHGAKIRDTKYAICDTQKKNLVTIVGAGITVHEALLAKHELEKQGHAVRVIDCYSIKPIDVKTLVASAMDSKVFVVVEDHYAQGGLGDAVFSTLATHVTQMPHCVHLAVNKPPMSGTPQELLSYEEIDSVAIVSAIRKLL